MKKTIKLLLGLIVAVLIVGPSAVFAQIQIEPENAADSKTKKVDSTKDGDFETFTYQVAALDDEYSVDAAQEDFILTGVVTVKYTLGKAIVDAKCKSVNNFTAESASMENGVIVCKYKAPVNARLTDKSIVIGALETKVDLNKKTSDADCAVQAMLVGVDGPLNPETGASLPIVIIGAGILLAAGIYTVTKKKTKLYNV